MKIPIFLLTMEFNQDLFSSFFQFFELFFHHWKLHFS